MPNQPSKSGRRSDRYCRALDTLRSASKQKMEIRYLKDSDKMGVCKLSHQINLDHYRNDPDVFCAPVPEGEDWSFWKESHDKKDGFVLVALLAEKVVGFLSAEITDTPDIPFLNPERKCRIATFVVCENHQRSGVGTRLYEKLSEIAKTKGANKIVLEVFEFNRSATEFYESKGFNVSAKYMSKSLA